jgi:hypothetical protein
MGSIVRMAAPDKTVNAIAGAGGLVMVYYLGWVDEIHYIGNKTGAIYTFGFDRKMGYVDVLDLPGFLDVTEDTKQAFELVQQ